jgi:hypothetical protein
MIFLVYRGCHECVADAWQGKGVPAFRSYRLAMKTMMNGDYLVPCSIRSAIGLAGTRHTLM